METENLGVSNQDELQSQANDLPAAGDSPIEAQDVSSNPENHPEHKRHRHQTDHSVSRKYKMFSNHYTASHLPHTDTSF